jgi:hypothetical protein
VIPFVQAEFPTGWSGSGRRGELKQLCHDILIQPQFLHSAYLQFVERHPHHKQLTLGQPLDHLGR